MLLTKSTFKRSGAPLNSPRKGRGNEIGTKSRKGENGAGFSFSSSPAPPLRPSVTRHTPLSVQFSLPQASLQPGPTHQLQIEPEPTENSFSSLMSRLIRTPCPTEQATSQELRQRGTKSPRIMDHHPGSRSPSNS